MSIDEARALFREQAQALIDGGVDVMILETFFDLNEIHAAMRGVRDVTDEPLVVQISVEDNGNSLEGTPPEVFAKRLDEWGADVLGLNCSVGPQTMLDAIERIANLTSKKLAAQPNAGQPRNIEGRNIYLCSPEYMASYAKKFVQHGVRIVGGCCGTTPDHIKAIRSAVQIPGPREMHGSKSVASVGAVEAAPPRPLETKSRLGAKLASGQFIKIVEMIPPVGHDHGQAIERARYLEQHHVDAINIPDAPRSSARMSAISLAILLEKSTEIESLAHYTCRDKNLLGMQADLLGAYALGLHNLLLTTGDPHQMGDYLDVTRCSTSIRSVSPTWCSGSIRAYDVGGKSIGKPTGFVIGVGANAGTIAKDAEDLKRFTYKVAGGSGVRANATDFRCSVFERFIRRIENCKIPIIIGILPLPNFKTAEFMHYEVPGCSVPEAFLERMRQAETEGPDHARAEGIAIAREILNSVRGMVHGVQIRGPFDRYETALEVLS